MASITEMMHQCIIGKPTPSIEIDEEQQKKQKQDDNTTNDLEEGSGAGYDDFLQFIKSGSEDDFMDNEDNNTKGTLSNSNTATSSSKEEVDKSNTSIAVAEDVSGENVVNNNQQYQSSSPPKKLDTRRSSIFAEREGHSLEFTNILLATKETKKKPSKIILNGLTSSIQAKTLTAVMGPSGSGKTSLLKLLTGRMGNKSKKLNYSGEIRLDGKLVDPTDIAIRKQIAYVEQDVSIPATCTPREAITFSARLRLDKATSDKEVTMVVDDILDNLQLNHVADTLIGGGPLMAGGLSGGEKKRVQCGVELVTNPEIIVLE